MCRRRARRQVRSWTDPVRVEILARYRGGRSDRRCATPGAQPSAPARRGSRSVHAAGEEVEEAVHDAVPLLGVELLGELHRALRIGEEDGHLLALAFEGAAGREYLLGQVLRRV